MKGSGPGRFSDLGGGRFQRLRARLLELEATRVAAELAGCLLLSIFLILMVRHEAVGPGIALKEGDLSSRTLRVHRALEVEDIEATEQRRLEAKAKVPVLYELDPNAFHQTNLVWKGALTSLRNNSAAPDSTRRQNFAKALGAEVTAEEFEIVEEYLRTPAFEASASALYGELWDRYLTPMPPRAEEPIEIRDSRSRPSKVGFAREFAQIMSMEEARSRLQQGLRNGSILPNSIWKKLSVKDRKLLADLQLRFLRPNLIVAESETRARRDKAAQEVRPILHRLEKGEVLVRDGERVSKRTAQILASLAKSSKDGGSVRDLFLEGLFFAILLWLGIRFLRVQFPSILGKHKDVAVAAALLLVSVGAQKLTLIFQIDILAERFSSIPMAFFLFMIPVAAPAMIVRLLLSPSMTVLFSMLFSLATVLLVEKAALYGLYVFVACLMGSMTLGQCKTRNALYTAGLKTALACAVMATALLAAWGGKTPLAGETESSIGLAGYAWTFLAGLIGGWLASAITLVLTPVLENILDYTTDLKLLELARMDHPVLRDLVVKAPGTYHHSIVVGSLSEAACEAVGANALLTRVGAYYHDIGKIGRAEYFVENQQNGQNPHDHTKPQLSAKIIISHVREGRVMAESHKLGRAIIDFIEEHHGTSLVSFFYNKAKQEAARPDSPISPEEVREEDFRYQGPRPQTKESAILALADSCEAATRSLVDPTPARIEGMVTKIFQKALNEGLLDDADITIRELHLVAQSFIRILLGIHHNRIQYPDQEKDLPPAHSKVARLGTRS